MRTDALGCLYVDLGDLCEESFSDRCYKKTFFAQGSLCFAPWRFLSALHPH